MPARRRNRSEMPRVGSRETQAEPCRKPLSPAVRPCAGVGRLEGWADEPRAPVRHPRGSRRLQTRPPPPARLRMQLGHGFGPRPDPRRHRLRPVVARPTGPGCSMSAAPRPVPPPEAPPAPGPAQPRPRPHRNLHGFCSYTTRNSPDFDHGRPRRMPLAPPVSQVPDLLGRPTPPATRHPRRRWARARSNRRAPWPSCPRRCSGLGRRDRRARPGPAPPRTPGPAPRPSTGSLPASSRICSRVPATQAE